MLDSLIIFINRHLVPLLAGLFLFRVAYLSLNGLDLVGDESYYWDWSRRPDWCYYSKPPMVAWLIGIASYLGGADAAVVRLPTVVLGSVFFGYLYATTRALYSEQVAALTVLLVVAMPANVLANFIMTIDPPLYCFWMMALYYLQRALLKNHLWSWLWAGVATGLAVLSKQTALLLPLLLAGFLLTDPLRRPSFRREFWLYLLPVALSLLPILLWNAQHDWVMFGHSKGHFGVNETASLAKRLGDTASFWLYQLLLASPVLFVLTLIMTYRAAIRYKHLTTTQQFLLWMGPIPLIGILLLSLLQKVQGNWPIAFYFSAMMLLAGEWFAGYWKKWLPIAVNVGLLMVTLTYALPVSLPALNLQNTVIDPTYRFRHWQKLANAIEIERKKAIPHPNDMFVLTVGHRFLASQLAFYLPDHPTVYRFQADGRVISQYEVWGWPDSLLGKTAFIVSEKDDTDLPETLKSAFLRFNKLGEIVNPMQKTKRYYVFMGENLIKIP